MHDRSSRSRGSRWPAASLLALAVMPPGRKLARFYQLANKLDAVLHFQLARGVPVVKP